MAPTDRFSDSLRYSHSALAGGYPPRPFLPGGNGLKQYRARFIVRTDIGTIKTREVRLFFHGQGVTHSLAEDVAKIYAEIYRLQEPTEENRVLEARERMYQVQKRLHELTRGLRIDHEVVDIGEQPIMSTDPYKGATEAMQKEQMEDTDSDVLPLIIQKDVKVSLKKIQV